MGQCDNCMASGIKTRRLELGGGSGMTLCDDCLRAEIKWRKIRNVDLLPDAKFRTKYKFSDVEKKLNKMAGF